ncbi:unnamed protein product [Owenia fusiformis]|uniref:Uncharacterized protein n=1 Tax=Owenia fusiformis TaxID=6347 RepID=A0A8S4MXZ6_OWEFU|nr:unnamed protein product [Owenia fusiformis]
MQGDWWSGRASIQSSSEFAVAKNRERSASPVWPNNLNSAGSANTVRSPSIITLKYEQCFPLPTQRTRHSAPNVFAETVEIRRKRQTSHNSKKSMNNSLEPIPLDKNVFSLDLKNMQVPGISLSSKQLESCRTRDDSTTSPSVPFNTEIVPNYSDIHKQESHRHSSVDDCRPRRVDSADKDNRRRNHQFERQNGSRNTSRKSQSLVDRRESLENGHDSISKDDQRNNRQPPGNKVAFKGGGKGNFLTNQVPASQTNAHNNTTQRNLLLSGSGTNSSIKDAEELVAMGTLWQPPSTASGSTKPGQGAPSNRSVANSTPQHRKVPSRSSIVHHPQLTNRQKEKESEPKYPDPMVSSFPSFQQRLSELSMLEADTIRYERNRKIKKKPKQDS